VEVFGQYEPARQGMSAVEPGGQKLPVLHSDLNDGEEQ
jgi:hypothetical protein